MRSRYLIFPSGEELASLAYQRDGPSSFAPVLHELIKYGQLEKCVLVAADV